MQGRLRALEFGGPCVPASKGTPPGALYWALPVFRTKCLSDGQSTSKPQSSQSNIMIAHPPTPPHPTPPHPTPPHPPASISTGPLSRPSCDMAAWQVFDNLSIDLSDSNGSRRLQVLDGVKGAMAAMYRNPSAWLGDWKGKRHWYTLIPIINRGPWHGLQHIFSRDLRFHLF